MADQMALTTAVPWAEKRVEQKVDYLVVLMVEKTVEQTVVLLGHSRVHSMAEPKGGLMVSTTVVRRAEMKVLETAVRSADSTGERMAVMMVVRTALKTAARTAECSVGEKVGYLDTLSVDAKEMWKAAQKVAPTG